MTETLRVVLAGGIVLGVMVLLHEWGHFIAAKLCGVRVDVFSIGFGPRLWGVKRGDTDYRLSALPLGGYVRMAGDNPVAERTGAAYEFLSRPRWQRFLIAIAGPAMNILLTFGIFWGIYLFVGMPMDTYLGRPAVVAAVSQNSPARPGVQPGDRIIAVNGVNTSSWESVLKQVDKAQPGKSISLTVDRAGATQTLTQKAPQGQDVSDSLVGYPAMPAVADEIALGSPAERAGMKADDTIISINGQPVVSWMQLVDQVRNSNGHSVHFVVRRGDKEIPFDITPAHALDADGQLAWQVGVSEKTNEVFVRQGFIESVRDAGLATIFVARARSGRFSEGFLAARSRCAI